MASQDLQTINEKLHKYNLHFGDAGHFIL